MKKMIAVLTVLLILLTAASAEEKWIICQPNDYINARAHASRRSASLGRLEAGDTVNVTGKVKNGFAYADGLSLESDDGWVFAGYLADDEPVWSGERYVVVSRFKLACRRWIDGPVRKWLHNGDNVTVYWLTDKWAVTSQGFIMTEYLEVDPE